ncbi:hypothetical protein [Pajaroellobacter abortibovis]|uniref:Uncharacterized protein n=1 Tax=Pajaroellobacter abortibovis TaxID=1882918 RepID=A0A1L6MWY1_9BACT|nr:hypothetical protein [Pajaroellobacter abortibovis]APS00053.1 hypothetical protein BCY86_04685 [Pajaroellobacter abortibovis]
MGIAKSGETKQTPSAKSTMLSKTKATSKATRREERPRQEKKKRKTRVGSGAPWITHHAAKQKEKAKANELSFPGSARSTLRAPQQTEDLKATIADLHTAVINIKKLRKNLSKRFWEIGSILKDIQSRKLYAAKGYGTFESFLEREVSLGKTTSLRLVRIASLFFKEPAQACGFERILNALYALDGINESAPLSAPLGGIKSSPIFPPPPSSMGILPLKPPGR